MHILDGPTIYYIIFVFSIILHFVIERTKVNIREKEKSFLIVMGVLLVLIAAFRDNSIGNDLNTYLDIFYHSEDIPVANIIIDSFSFKHFGSTAIYNGSYEVGYILLNKIIIFFTDSDFVFKLVISSIIITSYFYFFYKYSENVYLSFYIFYALGYYAQSMVIIRQCIALSVLLFSLKYINEHKLINFSFIVLLACLFHKSAIVFLISYPLCNIKCTKKNIIILLCVTVILFIALQNLLPFMIKTFYPFYMNLIVTGEGFNYFMLLFAIFILGMLCIQKKEIMESNKPIIAIYFVGMIIQLFAFNFSLLNRLALYFQFYMMIFIPLFINNCKYKKVLLIIMLIFLMFYFHLITIKRDAGGTSNYKATYISKEYCSTNLKINIS